MPHRYLPGSRRSCLVSFSRLSRGMHTHLGVIAVALVKSIDFLVSKACWIVVLQSSIVGTYIPTYNYPTLAPPRHLQDSPLHPATRKATNSRANKWIGSHGTKIHQRLASQGRYLRFPSRSNISPRTPWTMVGAPPNLPRYGLPLSRAIVVW